MKKVQVKLLILIVLILAVSTAGCKNVQQPIVFKNAYPILETMTLEDKVYQMMVISASEVKDDSINFGGIVYFKKDIGTIAETQAKLEAAKSGKKIPPLLAVDEEGGRVSRLKDLYPELGYEPLPPMAEITDDGTKTGQTLADVLNKVGFNTDFAPVADVGQDSEAIGNRAFSTDPEIASEKVTNVVKALASRNIISSLKHFPGHGSALADTHEGMSITEKSREGFETVDFLPFEAGIKAGADMIMTAHITAPSLDPESVPATFSKPILTDILRGQLGFEGVIITDALGMGAVAEMGAEGCIKAIEAGVDILLMPVDYTAAKDAIIEAVNSGRISEERINESVLRILKMKEKHGLI
ncbi:MAG: glycoside hydrolase family 3 protein [Ruminococcus sp.]|jgi:beta-N-acetylhexosaminidase|nr:glycoside hydrolase family 3 protein [Ruminococcus sp.]